MFPEVEGLLKIQQQDLVILELKKKLQEEPRKLKQAQERCASLSSALEERKEELKKMQVERKTLEVELDTKLNNISKYETQLYQIKTNQEYKALEKEIGGLKTEAHEFEDRILEKMEVIEELSSRNKAAEQELEAEKARLKQTEKEVAEETESVHRELANREKKRAVLAGMVSEPVLATYQKILDNKGGSAVVPIEKNQCQGCHMEVAAHILHAVYRSEHIVICENCARMLFIAESVNKECSLE